MSFRTELKENAFRRESTGPYADNLSVDALVVGAGFGGIFCLHELRKLGLNTVIFEAGNELGGTWRWNCYPGAGVDSEVPEYMYSIPETWKDWNWSTNYPSYDELRRYFDHVDGVLQVKKDCAFNSVVIDAQFDVKEGRWHVKTADGRSASARYFIVATGFSAKRYIPEWSGMDKFKGIVHHSSFWPDEHIDVRGKRCAVIGTGASGVQVTQAWGPTAGSLKVFQRTPNLALPMKRRALTVSEQEEAKKSYPELFSLREKCFGGFLYTFDERDTFDDNEEERQAFYEKLWDEGGFRFWLANYKDYLFDAKANRPAYDFWSKKTRERIGDPKQRDLLAPLEPPHHFGVKRPSLQSTYYEQFNRPNVEVIDIKNNNIVGFTENGIELQDGAVHELDVICIATGFDISTGGMTNMGLRSIYGTALEDEWKAGAYTYLGTTVRGYPNMFHLYGPHGPTLFSNGPTTVEIQGRWIAHTIKQMERQNIKYINPTREAIETWKKRINHLSDITLFPTTKSTYMGGSLPGKVFEQVNYAGGEPAYAQEIRSVLPNFDGFDIAKSSRETGQVSSKI
ncbi:Steroid monooxygenase (CpmA) [Penicillium cosmopolitanum]|uniref:Steroid monooxygenase (CpmA) n=1 Tax=Penicillium cosmopolitanum TaxID=1131564 RepID=A0A9W9VR62_9EURO|nr:Steroid monooxygenase (CpmA) [Penicillium cosmopolitanum]KAJ5387744.1 Steroid monooxygenase (CpmA) [Penicillium cosmopolitanum]